MEIATLVISIIALIGVVGILVLVLRKKDNQLNIDEEAFAQLLDPFQDNILKETTESIKRAQEAIEKSNQMMINFSEKSQDKTLVQIKEIKESNEKSFDKIENRLRLSIEDLKSDIRNSLSEMNNTQKTKIEELTKNNEKRLEEIRGVVDEKLTQTLDTRITNAFKQVTDSLSSIQKGLGEMQELTKQVGGLNKVFSNVKARGNWGEVSLESLLTQVLTKEQYEKQFKLKKGDVVDFAIKMPGKGNKDFIYLPIDAKFPMSDYEKLVEYTDNCEYDKIDNAKKALIKRIKEEAKSISIKYIDPPKTTDFAIMFLPTEGLYAEIIKDPGLCSTLQVDYKIIPCGPTVINALLNSLQVGFTTLKIQKSSLQVVDLLKEFKKEFTKFTDLTSKVSKNAKSVVESIEEVEKRNQTIVKKLSKIDDIQLEQPTIPSIEGPEL